MGVTADERTHFTEECRNSRRASRRVRLWLEHFGPSLGGEHAAQPSDRDFGVSGWAWSGIIPVFFCLRDSPGFTSSGE